MHKIISRKQMRRLTAIADRLPNTIPEALIERLRHFEPCFIKVHPPGIGNKKSGKAAFEDGFQKHPYNADDPSLQEHLKRGGNYGVLAGKSLAIVETDTEEATRKMEAIVNTFAVKSGGGGWKRHFYITINFNENGVLDNPEIKDARKRNVGHVQVERKYVVGPGSRHWTGNIYEIINDHPIAFVSKQQLEEIFGDWLKWTGQQRREIKSEIEQRKREGVDIPFEKLFADCLPKMKLKANDEYQGAHPLHGSETGVNFTIHPILGWYCFRHSSGGDWLMWIAVKHGLIECHEARPGVLRGPLFIEACRLAKADGFDVKVIDEELTPNIARFFKEDKKGNCRFVPARVAKELMNENHFLTQPTRKKEGIMFRYNPENGIYQPDGESYINAQTIKKLGKAYDINRENQIKAFIEGSTYTEIPETSKELIAVKNGVLNVITLEFFPFSPDYYIFNALPVIYDSNAKCPRFDKFLSEVVPLENGRMVVQEHTGYCLLKDCRFQRALMLTGLRQNGKSTFLYTIKTMLGGDKNVSAVPLHTLSNPNRRFAVTQLYNKLANICADLPAKPLRETDTFKKSVSGDELEGEFKFQQEFTFTPYAKHMYSANQLPPPPQDIEAFIVRWDIVDFPNNFMPGDPKRDPNLKAKLTTPEELSGIFNWALKGLQRLLENNQFTASMTTMEAIEEWSVRSDALKVFVEQCVIHEIDLTDDEREAIPAPTANEIYDAYFEFCKRHKVSAKPSNTFTREFPTYSMACIRRTTINKKQVRFWDGVRLRSATPSTSRQERL